MGSMMAVEGDLTTVESLLSAALAGSTAVVQAAAQLAKEDSTYAGLRVKVLNVTNAFHSSLVDPLTKELVPLGQALTFRDAKIRLERATETAEGGRSTADFVSHHLRSPVYFHHAATRLSEELKDAIWLEAGSNSTISVMANKAVGGSGASHFQSINITTDGSYSLLTDATTKLWQQGLDVTFWGHHKPQISDYSPLLLPPYQFEKSRHWLDIKQVPVVTEKAAPVVPVQPASGLINFFSFLDDTKRSVRFLINTAVPEFKQMVEAHIMASTVEVMPGMYPVEIAIDAISTLWPEFRDYTYQPELQGSPASPSISSQTLVTLFRGIFIRDRVDRWMRAPGLRTDPAKPKEWEVFAVSSQESDSAFISDVFAFDARNGSLFEAILGIRYSKVPIAGIRKALNRVVAENPLQQGY
ncbi:hypothetical protein TsFJ059_004975 [Trichoderma semiorbis]|uniref:Malonyl-CoA:ACP transacylase (MAT) domain-containing protein n=1 Tax=Trichoderma semiorbis TaxID=1491008 RepID=A0A9P8KT23_9HYPO|nr:hypothetical protein TsFJ059_004975 [Trichoderma semiorbis]